MKKISLLSLLLLAFGCGGPDEITTTKDLQTLQFDVGGQVAYALGDMEGLDAVSVTLTDSAGIDFTTTTTAQGLWFLADLAPGPYLGRFSAAGYGDEFLVFSTSVQGENDVENPFIGVATVFMNETEPVVTVSGVFSVTLNNGDNLVDGAGTTSAVYGLAAGGDIVVTTDIAPLVLNVSVADEAGTTSSTVNATRTVATVAGTALQALPLTADDMLGTTDALNVSVTWFTPIHGDLATWVATVNFNVVP